jgi:UTP--glucose-1-phosphate uridylyltransferase
MEAVVTLAGEGTRMLPWTRGLRKEFLPLFDRAEDGVPVLKPVAHLVVETLHAAGADRFTLVVQPKDRAFVAGYFAIDARFLERHQRHAERLAETRRFYRTIRRVRFRCAVQLRPRGFGDAVLASRRSVGHHPFLLHAGDGTLLERRRGRTLATMARLLERDDLDGVLLVRHVADPRRYGVVEARRAGTFDGVRRLAVGSMVEKPARPKTHWAATAVYAFRPSIYAALERYRRRRRPAELELTDGIRTVIEDGGRVAALVLAPGLGEWRSVGSPEGYARALARSRAFARRPRTAQQNG